MGVRGSMPPHYGKFIAYFRVSTDRQGKSGLGLAAQREAVMSYLDGGRWALVDEFTEVESGKRNERPELAKALAACKRQKAKLVIAKLDRLSRNLAFIATLMDSGVEFVAVDNPHANKLTIHILAAVAQHEREIISARTSAALKAAKARGRRLGNAQPPGRCNAIKKLQVSEIFHRRHFSWWKSATAEKARLTIGPVET
jgi:DNA invertase Pin-like site-specific DNA recombinase